jgi:hypothetical protein
MRTTITIDDALAEEAHRYGVSLSASAREGVAAAVRRAKELHDRQAYIRQPEHDEGRDLLEAWEEEGPVR